MSRKRMIDPGIWTDDGFMELSPYAKILYIGLISHADDAGRGVATLKSLKAKILPSESIAFEAIKAARDEIAANTRTRIYEVDGVEYYQLERWAEYQVINRPSPSKLPASLDKPVDKSPKPTKNKDSRNIQGALRESSVMTPGTLPEDSFLMEVNGIQRNGRENTQSARVRACADLTTPVLQESQAQEPVLDTPVLQEPVPTIYDPIPVPAKTEPPQTWIANEFYRAWSKRTATLLGPRGNDFRLAHGLLMSIGGRLSPEIRLQVGAAIDRYLDHWQDYWFARKGKPPGPVGPNHSFSGFCQHYPELAVETTAADAPDWETDPTIQAMLAGGT